MCWLGVRVREVVRVRVRGRIESYAWMRVRHEHEYARYNTGGGVSRQDCTGDCIPKPIRVYSRWRSMSFSVSVQILLDLKGIHGSV